MSAGMRAALLAVVALAAALRIHDAAGRENLHGDEAQMIGVVRTAGGVAGILENLEGEGHPPLVYLGDLLARRAGLSTEAELRGIRVVLGTLAVVLLMVFLGRFFGAPAALAGGLVMAASPFFVQQSADIRSYAAFLLLSLAHFGCVVLHGSRKRAWTAVLWGVCAGVLCGVHYYAIHQVAAAGLFLLWHDRTRAGFARVVLAGACCVAVFAPWIPVFLSGARTGATANWYVHDIGWSQFWRFAEAAAGGLGALVVLWAMADGWTRGGLPLRAGVAIAGGSALAAWLAHVHMGPYLARYLCGTATVAMVPLGFALGRLLESRRAAGAGLLVLVLASQQLDGARWRKPPSNGAVLAGRIEERFRPGDVVWAYPEFDAMILRYHLDPSIPVHVPGLGPAPAFVDVPGRWKRLHEIGSMDAEVRRAQALLREKRRVFFVSQFLGDWAAEHSLDRGYRVPHDSPLSRPEVREGMRVWRAFDRGGRVEHVSGGGDRGLRISMALMTVEAER